MKSSFGPLWAGTAGVLLGLLAAGGLFLATRPPHGQPVRLIPAPSAAPLAVHVSGAVMAPGIYNLPVGSRVYQAIEAAGGALPEANPEALNLAAVLEDGQRVHLPAQVPTSLPALTGQPGAPGSPASAGLPASASSGKININTASSAELESLPGIGPALAGRIIDFRNTHGPFASIEQIQDVSGIGPAKFEAIKDLISVQDSP